MSKRFSETRDCTGLEKGDCDFCRQKQLWLFWYRCGKRHEPRSVSGTCRPRWTEDGGRWTVRPFVRQASIPIAQPPTPRSESILMNNLKRYRKIAYDVMPHRMTKLEHDLESCMLFSDGTLHSWKILSLSRSYTQAETCLQRIYR